MEIDQLTDGESVDTTGTTPIDSAVARTAFDGHHALLSARGEFDRDNRAILIAAVEAAFVAGHTVVALDVSRVTFIDASVVNALVDYEQDARAQGRSFHLINCSPAVERVLSATGTFTTLCGNGRRGGDGVTLRPRLTGGPTGWLT